MPAYTTVLGLYKPGGGASGQITPDEPADIDKLNDNFDRLDSAVGFGFWTTSNRPTRPFSGQTGYNSTLDTWERWGGSGWTGVLPNYLQASTISSTYASVAGLQAGALDGRYFTQQALLTGGKLDGVYASKATQNQLNEYVDFSSHIHVAAGWSVNRLVLRRRAGFLMQLDASVTRTGGSLSGNIVNNRMFTVDGGYGSSNYQGLASGPGGYPNSVYVQSTGIYLASIAPTITITNGNEVTAAGLWIQS